MIMHGGSVGFYHGDPLALSDDMIALQPTVFPSVPKVFQRVYAMVHEQLHGVSSFKRGLWDHYYAAEKQRLENGDAVSCNIVSARIFSRVRQRFGGRVRLVITGSAPITPDLFRFLQVAYTVHISLRCRRRLCSSRRRLASLHIRRRRSRLRCCVVVCFI